MSKYYLCKILMIVTTTFIIISSSFIGCGRGKKVLQKNEAGRFYSAGLQYLQAGNINSAYQELKKAKDLNPNDAGIHEGLGIVFNFQANYELALNEFNQALNLRPNNPETYNNIGLSYVGLNDLEEAITYFRKAMENPDYPTPERAGYNLANAYFQKKDYENAMKYYKDILAVAPNIVNAYYNLAEAQSNLKLFEDAVSTYESFEKIYDKNPGEVKKEFVAKIFLRWGLVCIKLKQKPLALEKFRKVLELTSESEEGKWAKKYLSVLE
ncbi:MAG: tetratricopeptide repeat protein [bacterium]